MFRLSCVALLLGATLIQAAPVPKNDSKSKPESSIENIRKMLDSKATFALNQPTSLTVALAQLSDEYKISFVLDKTTVQAMGFAPEEMMVEGSFKDTKLRNGVRNMLAVYGLTIAIVGDSVLVTTEEQAIYKQLKQRINVDYDNVPLNKALKDLAQVHGINIVIDPKTLKTKSAEAAVTLNVDDVPIEAVVRLACEMAGLKPARIGNVIYVTSEDRADKLKDSDSLVPNPSFNPGIPNPLGIPGGGGVVPALPIVPAAPAPAFEKKVVEDAPVAPAR